MALVSPQTPRTRLLLAETLRIVEVLKAFLSFSNGVSGEARKSQRKGQEDQGDVKELEETPL